jgi:hypothetical protein
MLSSPPTKWKLTGLSELAPKLDKIVHLPEDLLADKKIQAGTWFTTFDVIDVMDVTDADAIYLNADDFRFHIVDDDNQDHVIAYLDEITSPGNTVLVSEYIVNETPTGAVDNMNTVFALINAPETGTVQVFLNGVLQDPGMTNDYTISGSTVTFNTAPSSGKVRVSYIKV